MEIRKYLLKPFTFLNNLRKSDEDLFYENLFIKNNYWNSKIPNHDEKARWEAINRLISLHVENQTNNQILDIGCGRGWLSNLLCQFGNVTGVEPVRAVVRHARKMFPNIKFKVGTTTNLLKNKQNKFDIIVCSEVLEHIPNEDKNKFIQEIYELLNKEGYAIFSTPRAEAQKEWLKFSIAEQPIEEWISELELETMFNQNSFKTISIERVELSPVPNAILIPIYQVWMFKKV
jgi:2-polyprenyl-3-methyl-5-hydroxy-6-metoxy-1,4-benzoquinol methylase